MTYIEHPVRIDDNVSEMVNDVEKLEWQEYGSSSHEKQEINTLDNKWDSWNSHQFSKF